MKRLFAMMAMVVAGLTFGLTAAKTANASGTNRIISTSTMTKTAYVRKSSAGATYNMTGSTTNFTFVKTHSLKSYPSTTWMATKKRYIYKTNGKKYLYYYVTNAGNTASGWIWHGYLKTKSKSFTNMYKVAKSKLGASYSYGSVGPYSFDCSGYTRYVFQKAASKVLPHSSQSQYSSYKKVSRANAKKGDLVFFGTSTGSISHVGIYVGNGKMIDAQDNGVEQEKIYVSWWNAVGYSRPVNFGA
ncbi:C40 family peptidase [Lactiplantibacillus daowaiensis]|uniref:C40 family peptidase n=1 Tax=Lactiplantibacillus daowaiensis TaxID=2559918 RepID=A0ABW1RWF9_9LACO|nr:NlpC/P60 family protein [Lactiplantibacillus daowaiensis]